jgi:hypothetical protein
MESMPRDYSDRIKKMNPLVSKEVQYPEDIPTDECATSGEAALTHQGKNYPRGRDPDGHVSEASWQGEYSREHIVRIEGEEAQTGPSPGLHSRNEPKIQGEHELAEGLREPQRGEKENQGRCNSNRNGQGSHPGPPSSTTRADLHDIEVALLKVTVQGGGMMKSKCESLTKRYDADRHTSASDVSTRR